MGRGNRYKALWDYRSDLARKMDEKRARCDANVGADRGLGIAVLPRLPSSVLLAFLSSCLSRDVGNTYQGTIGKRPVARDVARHKAVGEAAARLGRNE